MNPAAQELRELFRRAVSLDTEARGLLLNSLHDSMRLELESLLDADQRANHSLDASLSSELHEPLKAEVFGPYEIDGLLGRGGMGAVYRAHRIDGAHQQEVAIKVLEHAWLDPRANERFRQERQFLAGLSHPNITRLIDGGTRADGLAYFVMEYVHGERIDKYCEEHKLDVSARLRLFLPVCAAVSHAHRKLIIHRDLKPSNVLVNQDGQPKLLDFGIAKALDANIAAHTQTLALTPAYASPEQIDGAEITTATDVYGLGAILYDLLTGEPPHRVDGLSPAALRKTIVETVPRRPSEIAPAIPADIDNILLKALHPEPARRYSSGQALADDIERYLAKRPVSATPDSIWYRTGKFVRRNALATMALVLAFLAASLGTAVSLYQAQRARQNFNAVRELADKFLFDFEASIRNTPGTLAARQKLVSTAHEYLSQLEQQGAGDRDLLRDIAASYFRLADIEEDTLEGQRRINDLTKAANILRALGDDRHGSVSQRVLYIDVEDHMVNYWTDDDVNRSLAPAGEALSCAEALYSQQPEDARASAALVRATSAQASAVYSVGRIRESLQWALSSVARGDEAARRFPQDTDVVLADAQANSRLSAIRGTMRMTELSIESANRTISLLERISALEKDSPRWWILRINTAATRCSQTGRLAKNRPELQPRLLSACRDMFDMAQRNVQRNPGNRFVLDQAYVMTTRYANQLQGLGRTWEALPILDRAGNLLDTLDRIRPVDHRAKYLRANYLTNRGAYLKDLNRWDEAAASASQNERLIQDLLHEVPGDTTVLNLEVENLCTQSAIHEHRGALEQAKARLREALQVAVKITQIVKGSKNPVGSIDDLREQAARLNMGDVTKVLSQDNSNATRH